MTINQVIEYVDRVKPNAFTNEDKCRWINTLEGLISQAIHNEDAPEYTLPDDAETPLLVDSPYDGIYHLYVSAMIDFYHREYDDYNNTILMYSSMLDEFKKWHIRNHMPKCSGNVKNHF